MTKLENNILKVLEFFGIKEEEKEAFLLQNLKINNLDEFNTSDEKVERFAEFFNINKQWIYGNSDYLLLEKEGFYKRYESFCKEILEKSPSKLYIISEKKPDKKIDEQSDNNHFYLVAEYKKILFNDKEISIFDIFKSNGCRWGYWRCRWEFKKLLLCLKKNYSINSVIGLINENISNDYYKFIKGEVKFEKLLGNMNIWYPEDYIEFKYENVNAKEEDELSEILKEIENVKISKSEFELLYKFKKYLIDVYGYSEEDIKIEYKIGNFRYDLVIFKDNQPFVGFELKQNVNSLLNSNFKQNLLYKFSNNFEYFVLVALYENEWYMECYQGNKLVYNFPLAIKKDEEFVIQYLFNLLYGNGKNSKEEAIKQLQKSLLKYIYKSNYLKELEITSKQLILLEAESNYILNFIIYRILSFVPIKNNKKIVEKIFDLIDERKSFLKFKEEFLYFLNNFVKNKNYSIIGFQPDFIKLNIDKCYIEDKNDYVYFIKKFLDKCNNENNFKQLIYFDVTNLNIEKVDFANYENGVLIVGYSFFNRIKKHSQYLEIVKKIRMIVNLSDPIANNTFANYSVIFFGKKNEKIYIANLDFEKLFKYEKDIIEFLLQNKNIKENEDIFLITNNDFVANSIETIKIFKVLKQIRKKEHKKLLDLVEIYQSGFCNEKGSIKKLITLKNIKYNRILSLENTSEKCLAKNEKTKLNDFVISKVGAYKFAEITKKYKNCIIDDKLFILRIKDKEYYKLVKDFLSSDLAKYIFNNLMSGFDINKRLFIKDLKKISIPINIKNIKIDYKEIQKNIYFTPCENSFIEFVGIEEMVFNFSTISGYFDLEDIEKIKLKNTEFQRNKCKEHIQNLVEFIKTKNARYKFLPFLVLGIENLDDIENNELNEIKGIKLRKICFKESDFENVKIIDGNHRWNAIKESLKDKNGLSINKIGVVFVNLNNKAYSPIFYTLNSKSKPLITSDYVNLMEQKEEILKELETLGMNSPNLYFEIRNFFKRKNLFNYVKNKTNLDEKILELVDFIEKNRLKKMIPYFKLSFSILNKFYYDFSVVFEITKSILKYYNSLKGFKEFKLFFKKEFNDFYQYLKETKILEKVEKLDLCPIFEVYKNTYIPKSRKIYLSMPYHIHEDVIYYVAKDVVNEVFQKIGEKIELIRTDKKNNTTGNLIDVKIYEDIKQCDLMIADITGNNPNVYAEVGYKMAIDKMNGIVHQIIFIENTDGYYEHTYRKEKEGEKVDEIVINEHIVKNKISTAFNFEHLYKIQFKDVSYLRQQLSEKLIDYFNYYQIKKV
jgi:hypothetical protein